MSKNTHGFTLLELSIVVVIIGFIVAGVLVGKDLIRSGEARKIVSEIQAFESGMMTFKIKYGCLAGDCRNSSTFMGGPTIFPPIASLGDNQIEPEPDNEYRFMLDQLYKTELFNSKITPHNANYWLAPFGLRDSSDRPAFWNVGYLTATTSSSIREDGHYIFSMGSSIARTDGAAIFTPDMAFDIDNKIDDGLPRGGRLLATGNDTLQLGTGNNHCCVFDPATDEGPLGETSNFCVVNTTPRSYNIRNISRAAGSLCNIAIKTTFD